ncbi:MAG: hypothetical protein ABSG25_12860 [Bryobacteraceae bacterium]
MEKLYRATVKTLSQKEFSEINEYSLMGYNQYLDTYKECFGKEYTFKKGELGGKFQFYITTDKNGILFYEKELVFVREIKLRLLNGL